MTENVTTIVLLAGAALVVGVLVAVLASKRAPDGFEDDQGFHLGKRGSKRLVSSKGKAEEDKRERKP